MNAQQHVKRNLHNIQDLAVAIAWQSLTRYESLTLWSSNHGHLDIRHLCQHHRYHKFPHIPWCQWKWSFATRPLENLGMRTHVEIWKSTWLDRGWPEKGRVANLTEEDHYGSMDKYYNCLQTRVSKYFKTRIMIARGTSVCKEATISRGEARKNYHGAYPLPWLKHICNTIVFDKS
jgi:hypothetical protein